MPLKEVFNILPDFAKKEPSSVIKLCISVNLKKKKVVILTSSYFSKTDFFHESLKHDLLPIT